MFVGTIVFSGAVNAAIVQVNPSSGLQNAINTAHSGDTLNLKAGIYYEHDITVNKNLIITGPKTTFKNKPTAVIDGQYKGRIFNITPNTDVTIQYLLIKNGNAYKDSLNPYGGALNKYEGIVNIENCILIQNKAYDGGAINNQYGTLTVLNSYITKNTAANGGGIGNGYGTMILINSTINYNTATYHGGGINLHDAETKIIDSNIYKNTGNQGGAVNSEIGNLKIKNSNIYNNKGYYGGGIYNYNSASMNYCRFFGNTATIGNVIFNRGGPLNAAFNWWGYNSAAKIASEIYNLGNDKVIYKPWIVLSIKANPSTVHTNEHSNITADLLHDSNGIFHNPANDVVPYVGCVNFVTTKGTINYSIFSNGLVTSTLINLKSSGKAIVSLTIDHQTVSTNIIVNPVASFAQIIIAAGTLKTYYELNHFLPTHIMVGSTKVTMPQFLYLLVTTTGNINVENLKPINIIEVNPAPASSGTFNHDKLFKSKYVRAAQNIKNFIIAKGRAPNFAITSLGNIPFSKLVYMYSKIVNFYGINNRLPNYVRIA